MKNNLRFNKKGLPNLKAGVRYKRENIRWPTSKCHHMVLERMKVHSNYFSPVCEETRLQITSLLKKILYTP
ncbi:hypothetical protein AQUCO_00300237v1 [Aquilegia coerulea]|uniref:Uncharacterized protein n=1 Tax=Aquilegia coerulea TaxID=218851 RepID=A0A2G5EXW2_AQUCA|nr:hypothetical protein AQUCO_00300237v1 [Aquilegia coerulea]